MISFKAFQLLDHTKVAVDELDGDAPLLEVIDEHPRGVHCEISPKRKMPNRTVQKDVHLRALVCFGLQNAY